ncbi:hypothetical protein [Polluticaenibacter yanchengensis]|uniref:DUF4488 domain-containing protein n=1 Tax=Polluticaenibacter yanchengensis TaxID=3014562 RepID=A0ABT4UPT3_9BACT|nr:hypothetical protein [Chitinophagaceae bacterium LY-5]
MLKLLLILSLLCYTTNSFSQKNSKRIDSRIKDTISTNRLDGIWNVTHIIEQENEEIDSLSNVYIKINGCNIELVDANKQLLGKGVFSLQNDSTFLFVFFNASYLRYRYQLQYSEKFIEKFIHLSEYNVINIVRNPKVGETFFRKVFHLLTKIDEYKLEGNRLMFSSKKGLKLYCKKSV